MKVSIIINTYNRAPFLRRLLNVLALQTYKDFEVVVVNGPSTDNSNEILDGFKDSIKLAHCDCRNLSVSRNIGIRNAAGEILIFIDDDAIPLHKDWIQKYVNAFQADEKLGVAGGKAFDGHGNVLFGVGTINVWGRPECFSKETVPFPQTDFSLFNVCIGCNVAFRKSAVLEVGGFDEYYEYYHDESDVEVRIAKAGYRVRSLNNNDVFHESATNVVRPKNAISNIYPVIKNQIYFGLKNSEGIFDDDLRIKQTLQEANDILHNYQLALAHHSISRSDYKKYKSMWTAGREKGLADGLHSPRSLPNDLSVVAPFKTFVKEPIQSNLSVALFEYENILNNNDGIAKYTLDLAESLAKIGINVHVVFPDSTESLFLHNDVNYHAVKVKKHNYLSLYGHESLGDFVDISFALAKKTNELIDTYGIQIVESPLWNYPGLLSTSLLNIPVVTRLQTPSKVVDQIHKRDDDDNAIRYELEKELLVRSEGIISISKYIEGSIEKNYDVSFADQMKDTIYLGVGTPKIDDSKKRSPYFNILFVGRLERRKGVSDLFEAIPTIVKKHPNVRFTFVGKDDIVDSTIGMTFKQYFKKHYRKYKNKVTLLGSVDNDRKYSLYKNCDLFVAPSLYESFGIIYVEAMSYGRAVIGCKAGGIPEVVTDGYDGLLAEPNNSADLSAKILDLIENDEKREQMNINAYKSYCERFSPLAMAKNTEAFYRKVIKNGKAN